MRYHGDLVSLRPREPEDGALFAAWHSDPETMRWWDRVYPPLPPDLQAERLAGLPDISFGEASFTLLDRTTETPIGWGGILGASPENRHAFIGVLIGDAGYRGRGYCTDATRTLCRFGFREMNLHRITLTVFPENVAARRAYERVGFVEEGVQRQAQWKRGAWHDLVHMAVFADTLR